jgi:GNAT superfamily N-acetyltransferase
MELVSPIIIRNARPEDAPSVFLLIQELAEYERAPEQVINTTEQMLRDGFPETAWFGCLVAESGGKIVGMALWYLRYSTWKGVCMYLEDLYVQPEFRQQGTGKALFLRLKQLAEQKQCRRLVWQVLDWNEPAIRFYEKLGSQFDTGWWNGFIDLPEHG